MNLTSRRAFLGRMVAVWAPIPTASMARLQPNGHTPKLPGAEMPDQQCLSVEIVEVESGRILVSLFVWTCPARAHGVTSAFIALRTRLNHRHQLHIRPHGPCFCGHFSSNVHWPDLSLWIDSPDLCCDGAGNGDDRIENDEGGAGNLSVTHCAAPVVAEPARPGARELACFQDCVLLMAQVAARTRPGRLALVELSDSLHTGSPHCHVELIDFGHP